MLSRQSPSGKTPPSASPAPPGSAHRPPRAGPPRTDYRAPGTAHRVPRAGAATWARGGAGSAPSRDPPSSPPSRSAPVPEPGSPVADPPLSLQRPRRPPGTSAEPRLEERRRGGLRGTGPARPPTSPHPGTGKAAAREELSPGTGLGGESGTWRRADRRAVVGERAGGRGRGARGAERTGGGAEDAGGRRDPAPAPLFCWAPLGLGRRALEVGALAVCSAEALRQRRGPRQKVPAPQRLRSLVRSTLGTSESGEQSSQTPKRIFPRRVGRPGTRASVYSCVRGFGPDPEGK